MCCNNYKKRYMYVLHIYILIIRTIAADTISVVTVIAPAFKAARCIPARSILVTIVCVLGTFVYICNALRVKSM